jgi:dephospho-CoA kinase
MLLGVVGLNGSGKDTVAKYLREYYGFEWVSLSDMVRKEVLARGLSVSNRDSLNMVAEDMRKKAGPSIWIQRSLENYSPEKDLVLSSFRHPSEIDIVHEKKGKMILVDAKIEIRFQRTVERVLHNAQDHGSVGFDDFKKKEERELSNPDKDKMQMGACVLMHDFKIDNNTSVENLYAQIDIVMKNLGKTKISL